MRTIPLFILLSSLWLSIAGGASSSQAGASLPFTLHGGLIWVDVQMEGQTEPLRFVFDTGAEVSILDLSTARHLDIRLGRKEPVQGVFGRSNAYHVGKFPASIDGRSLPKSILAFDLGAISRSVNRRIDGLLGADFFRRSTVRIDYVNQLITINREPHQQAAGETVIPLRRRGGILCTQMTINGVDSQWMRIDTGCSEPLHWATTPGNSARSNSGKSVAVAAGRVIFSETTVSLGNRTLQGVRTGLHGKRMFRDEDGLLGNGLLSKFNTVTLDTRQKKLFLK